jgi:phosphatidylethanolamine/phosphatidyl-N-methylethanolamine N-methyltransferase
MWRRVTDASHFLLHSLKAPRLTGALLPSSAALAHAVATSIDPLPRERRILEIGAGVGAITRQVARRLHPGDRLDVIDRNPSFCDLLEKRFRDTPQVRIICSSLLEWDGANTYDAILIGLPLNNFAAQTAEAVLKKSRSLLASAGCACYFEYLHVPAYLCLTEQLLRRKSRGRFARIEEAKRRFRNSFEHVEEQTIWRNFPPARVVTCWND